MVEIIPVPAEAVASVWRSALPLLAKSIELSNGCFEAEDVLGFCERGLMQMWIAAEDEKILAVYVTEIVTYPRKKRVRVCFAGSEPHTMREWLEPMIAAIEQWSLGWQCTGIEAVGRKGWVRILDTEYDGVWMARDYPSLELH